MRGSVGSVIALGLWFGGAAQGTRQITSPPLMWHYACDAQSGHDANNVYHWIKQTVTVTNSSAPGADSQEITLTPRYLASAFRQKTPYDVLVYSLPTNAARWDFSHFNGVRRFLLSSGQSRTEDFRIGLVVPSASANNWQSGAVEFDISITPDRGAVTASVFLFAHDYYCSARHGGLNQIVPFNAGRAF